MIDHYVSRDGLERTEVINMRSETADRFSGQWLGGAVRSFRSHDPLLMERNMNAKVYHIGHASVS